MENPNTKVLKSINFELDVYVRLVNMMAQGQSVSQVVNQLLKNQLNIIDAAKKEEIKVEN